MAESYITDGMLDMFLYESEQMLEQIENVTLEREKESDFDESSVNDIFRCMHTIKGSSGVMMYNNITTISHKLEDVFYYIRESHPENIPHKELIGHIMDVSGFIRDELEKIRAGEDPDGEPSAKIKELDTFLERLKNNITGSGAELPPENTYVEPSQFYIAPAAGSSSSYYIIHITYRQDTDMANIRAYIAVNSLKETAEDIFYTPEDIITDESSGEVILRDGFTISLKTRESQEEILRRIDGQGIEKIDITDCNEQEFFSLGKAAPVISLPQDGKVSGVSSSEEGVKKEPVMLSEVLPKKEEAKKDVPKKDAKQTPKQSFISVNVLKMDELMDLIGELVIAESVVLQNQDLKVPGLDLTNFHKAAGQLSKITTDLQNTIMSMRMMPLTNTFQKMNRIVYDVSRKLNKDVELVIIGETTEVDKNIIEHISDPLMHLVRNSLDHGVETKEDRIKAGKPQKATVTLEAKNEGGKVLISVKDDGKGLVREKILEKARANGLVDNRNEADISDKEVFSFITLPGFSTKEKVTEYSGRGVGMDVVVSNIQAVGGSLEIDSVAGQGSTMTMKIPLTLAIVDGIIVGTGSCTYVIPTEDVQEFVSVSQEQMVVEPEGTESMMLRGECYPVIRLKKFYGLGAGVDNVEDGIMVILDHEGNKAALFVDRLIGEQEIVVKPIPSYIKKVKGLSGCTQLGDGSISLILDSGSLMS